MHTARRRGIAARVGTVVAAIAAIAAMALPAAGAAVAAPSAPAASSASGSHTTCVPMGQGAKCTGTFNGDNAYDPWIGPGGQKGDPGAQISHPPVVTVSQTKGLTDQIVNVNWQYFTPTLGTGEQPNPVQGATYYKVSIYECKGTNPPVNPSAGLANSCYQATSESNGSGLPNAVTGTTFAAGATGSPNTYGWSGPATNTGGDPADWQGQAQFHIEAGKGENGFLGCDAKTPCSLVVVPNFGGTYNFDPSVEYTDTSQCGDHTFDDPFNAFGTASSNGFDSFACALNDRIVVPLSFAKTAANCPQSTPSFFAEGSPMMARAMTQWQIGWCTGSAPVNPTFDSTSESQARGSFLQGGQALSAGVDMALVTLPPDAAATQASSRKFTYAPLANSGVAMADYVDAQNGQQVNRVTLDPRLAAKLTTESYSLNYDCTVTPPPPWPQQPGKPSEFCDPAVAHNPRTVFDDPEFQALNKDCRLTDAAANFVCDASDFPSDIADGGKMKAGDFLPTVPAGENDMTFQMTDWIAGDADGAGFLTGKKDLWNTHVNSNYKSVTYPTQFFQNLDPGITYPKPLTCHDAGSCNSLTAFPDATMNVAWNFVTGLDAIANNLLALQPNGDQTTLQCPLSVNNGNCTNVGQMGFAVNPPEATGSRGLFSELDLGDVAAYQFPATSMVNAAGNAVAPTKNSVEDAVKDMKTNPDGITQFANQSSADPAAYPLAMVDYAMVPTCDLSPSKASAIADFLDKAATIGQTQGVTPGTLAPGYYPLTSKQRAQTRKAAQEVKTQDCKSAPPDPTVSGHHVNDAGGQRGGSGPAGPAGGAPGGGNSGKARNHTAPTSGATPPAATGNLQPAAFGSKSPDSGLTGILLLIAIIVGALALVGGPAAWVITATGKWPVVLRWLRPVLARLTAARAWLTGLLPTGRA